LLEELLIDFEGTLLLVSHDRAFMDNVVTDVLAFEGDGIVRSYVGGYTDWVRQGGRLPPAPWELAEARKAQEKLAERQTASTQPAKNDTDKRRQKLSYKLQRELDTLPATIESLESQIAGHETRMGAPDFYQQDSETVSAAIDALSETQAKLDRAMERWMELEAMAEGDG